MQGKTVHTCAGCGGLWFGREHLAGLMVAYDPDLASFDQLTKQALRAARDGHRACPACHRRLAHLVLHENDRVEIEVCRYCRGVWLDHGEFERLLAGREYAEFQTSLAATLTWRGWIFQLLSRLPLEFNFRPRRLPVVTYGLIAVNCLVFAMQWLTRPQDWFWLTLVPAEVGQPVWFVDLVTYNFLHINLIHLLGNMYFLWILGDNVEDVLGRWKFLIFYLLACVCSGLAVSASVDSVEVPRLGASGAVSAVMAAYAVLFRRSRLTFMFFVFQRKLTAPVFFGIWVGFNLLGFYFHGPGVAWEAHLGGFAFGLVTALFLYGRLTRRDPLLRLLNGLVTDSGT